MTQISPTQKHGASNYLADAGIAAPPSNRSAAAETRIGTLKLGYGLRK